MGSLRSSARKWLLFAAVFLAINGFFVARVPDATRPELAFVSSLFVLGLAAPSFAALFRWLGAKQASLTIIFLGAYAVGIESVGRITGFPYGEFEHHNEIGWKFFGLVPWTVPFAWIPLVLASATMASRMRVAKWQQVVLSAAILVAIDGVLDPGAVHQSFWSYKHPGLYYAVPASNFFGWFLSGSVGSLLLFWISRPQCYGTWPPVLASSAFLILAFWTSVCLFAGLWIPAFLGFGLLYFLGRVLMRRSESTPVAP